MPFDASDMFVKPKIRLYIVVIIFQLFVWKITELMQFFNNMVTGTPTQHMLSGLCSSFATEGVFTYHLLCFVVVIPLCGWCKMIYGV